MTFKKPVLLCNFNRPEFTAKLVDALRPVMPDHIFVSIDGPRAHVESDLEQCSTVLDILQKGIDWPCNIKWLVNESNKGCGRCVSEAISWFFEHVEEGIILEDDCIPSEQFFKFAEKMLDSYRDDHRVATICGLSFLPVSITLKSNYWFSKYTNSWGWATWKRTWLKHDYFMKSLDCSEWEEVINQRIQNPAEISYWKRVLHDQLDGKINSWDYQLLFSVWKDNQVNISPLRNLVKNIGFDGSGTHTNYEKKPIEIYNNSNEIYEISSPESNQDLDNILFYLQFLDSNKYIYGLENPIGKILDNPHNKQFNELLCEDLVKCGEKQREYIAELEGICNERSHVIIQLDQYKNLVNQRINELENETFYHAVIRKMPSICRRFLCRCGL